MVRIRDCLSCGEGSIPSITAKLRFVMQLEDMLVLETESCGFDSHRIDTYRRSTVVVARDSYPLGRWFKSTRRYKENRMLLAHRLGTSLISSREFESHLFSKC